MTSESPVRAVTCEECDYHKVRDTDHTASAVCGLCANRYEDKEKSEINEYRILKPCPFCGSDRLHIYAMDDGVRCWECSAKITGVPDWQKRWNRRVYE